MRRLVLLLSIITNLSFCKDPGKTSQREYDNVSVKDSTINEEGVQTILDTANRKSIFNSEGCSSFIDDVKVIFDIDLSGADVCEMKNGLVYIHGQGILHLADGKLFKLTNESDRLRIEEILGDSILCIRLTNEQHIFNLHSDYRYYKKQWVTTTFSDGTIESYNSGIVPVFENDSTVLITDLKSNRIIDRLSGNGRFFKSVVQYNSHIYLGSKKLYKINLINGKKEFEIPIPGGLGSNIIVHGNEVFFWDRAIGITAVDVNSAQIKWQYVSNKPNSDVKIMADASRVYFNDGKVKAIDRTTGKLLWIDSADEWAVRNNNISLIGNYLATGFYYDSDAVIALININTGSIVCNGADMPQDKGYYRYKFFDYQSLNSFYAIDRGGYDYKIVRFDLQK